MVSLTVIGKMKKYYGFSLIELLVVMAIIGMLLAVVTPRYFSSMERAKETALRHDLTIIRESISQFYQDTNRYPESLDELVQRKYLRNYPVDPITGRSDTWIGYGPPDPSERGLYTVISGAEGVTSDGVPYADL